MDVFLIVAIIGQLKHSNELNTRLSIIVPHPHKNYALVINVKQRVKRVVRFFNQ